MKTIFRTMFIAGAIFMVMGCGNNGNTQQSQTEIVAEELPIVAVQQVNARDVLQTVTYPSTVQAFVKNNIAPQMSGRITKINAEIGDFVKKGDVLAEMDKAQFLQAQLQLQNQEVELARLQALYDAGGLSKSDLDAVTLQYNVTKTQVENLMENTVLRSPVDGVVTARNYDAGDLYGMSAPIFTVEQIVPVKLLVGVSEIDYSKVSRGDEVTIKVDALPDHTFYGKVGKIYPTIDPATRTFTVEIVVDNKYKTLRPGMFARVTINFGTNHSVVIPDVAVVKQQGSGERFVYVLNEDGTVNYQKVVLGRRMGAEYEVLEGLKDGDKVVTGGQIRLKDGVKVKVTE